MATTSGSVWCPLNVLFPQSDRETYDSNPLEEVVCQLRFSPILRISQEVPAAFQDTLRRSGFPGYSSEYPTPFQIPEPFQKLLGDIGVSGIPGLNMTKNHRFTADSGQQMITLNQGFLAVLDKDYRRWSSFKQIVALAEKAFRAEYEPVEPYLRVGLRYRNLVKRGVLGLAGMPWGKLLKEELLGPLGRAADDEGLLHKQWFDMEVQLPERPTAFLRFRHGLAREAGSDELYYGIDSDFYTTVRSSPDEAFEQLDFFNKRAGDLFRWSITNDLRRALGPRSVE